MKKTIFFKLIFIDVVFCLLASFAISGLAEGAPASTQPPGPRYGGILRTGEPITAKFLGYPARISGNHGVRQAAPAIETLLHYDKTAKPQPWLATGFKENAEAKTITLTLRRGVKFHDGADFNAEAVKWNLEQCISAKTPGTQKFKSIDVIDDYTVRINLTEWDSTAITGLCGMVGMIISPVACKKNGVEWAEKNLVGTGPFQFVSWEPDVVIKFKKFDGYWQKGKPYLNGIEIIFIADPLTREISFRKGELDVLISLEAKPTATLEKDGYSVFRQAVGSGGYGLVPDSADPKSPFANLKVRQATAYAIDTELIVKSILLGGAEAINQYAYKAHWGYNPNVIGYPYNPNKAKQLLAEAGYPNGFKTKITYWNFSDIPLAIAAVQAYLKAVGIDAELDPADYGRWFQIFGGGKWEGLYLYTLSGDPEILAAINMRFGGIGRHTQMLVPDDCRQAIQNALTAPDFKTKQKWVWDVQKLIVDKYCLAINMFSGVDNSASQTYVHDTQISRNPFGGVWTPEDAWLDKK